jgi:hypothetical protein
MTEQINNNPEEQQQKETSSHQNADELKETLSINRIGIHTEIGTMNVFDKATNTISITRADGEIAQASETLVKNIVKEKLEFKP